MDNASDYIEMLQGQFAAHANKGLPAFPHGISQSNPLNSTPFYADFAQFTERYGWSEHRDRLIRALKALVGVMKEKGLDPELLLVGGSFIEASNHAPNDIDCVIFYSCAAPLEAHSTQWLLTIRERAKIESLDTRFVPTDGGLIVLLKSAIYFSSLYSISKTGGDPKGVVIVGGPF